MKLKLSPLHIGIIFGSFAFLFYAICMNVQPHGWPSWYKLAVNGEKTTGTITSKKPELHNTCYFVYMVNSKNYLGADQGCKTEIGQQIVITYLPAEPEFSTASSPGDYLTGMIFGPLVLSIFGGSMTALSYSRRRAVIRKKNL